MKYQHTYISKEASTQYTYHVVKIFLVKLVTQSTIQCIGDAKPVYNLICHFQYSHPNCILLWHPLPTQHVLSTPNRRFILVRNQDLLQSNGNNFYNLTHRCATIVRRAHRIRSGCGWLWVPLRYRVLTCRSSLHCPQCVCWFMGAACLQSV